MFNQAFPFLFPLLPRRQFFRLFLSLTPSPPSQTGISEDLTEKEGLKKKIPPGHSIISQRLSAEWMSDHQEMNEEQAGPGFGAQQIVVSNLKSALGRCVTSRRSLNLSELQFP